MAVAVADQACDQIVAGGPFDHVFACGIDIRDPHDIGVVKAGAEFVKVMRASGCSGAVGARRSRGPRSPDARLSIQR